MKPSLQIAAVALFAWSGLALEAAAQDKAPPGCRWQGYQGETVLACKDAQGYWRRSGDDEIVGYDPPKRPKPKPAATAAAPIATAPAPAAPIATAPAPPPPATNFQPPPVAEASSEPAPEATPPVVAEPPAAPTPPPPAPPQPPAPKPWWEGLWASVWQAILGFLKMVGLLH